MNRRGLLTIGLSMAIVLMLAIGPLGAQPSGSGSRMAPPLRDISDSFAGGSGPSWVFLVFFICLAALAIGLVYFDIYIRRQDRTGIDNPLYLFTELVRVHELTRVEKQFLEDFADESNLVDPLPLFVEPEYFLSALDDDRFQESYEMIAYLLKKLFGIERGVPRSSTKPRERSSSGLTTIIRPTR